jgi:hypothetical protein
MRQTQKRTQVEASESQKSVESVREAAEPLHEFGEEIAQPVPDIVPMSHQFVSDGVVESQSTSSDLQSDEVTFFVTAPTSESKSKFVPAPETMPENLPELPQMDSTEAVSDSSSLAFPDSFDAHLSSVEELQAAGVAFSQERLKRIEAYRSLRHLPPEDLFPEAPVNVAQAEQTPYFEIPDTDRDVPQLPVIVVTQSVESENSTGLFSSAAPSSDVPAIPGEFADQHPDLDVSLLSPSDTGIASGAPLDLDNTPADLAPLPPEARFEVASKSPERGPRTEVANGHNDQFSMNSQLYLQSDAMLPNLPRDAVATNDNPQMSHRGTPRTGNYQQSVPRPQNQSKSTATHRPAITQKKPGAGNSFMSTTFRRMKKHVTRVTGPVDLPDFRLPQVDRPDFEWADFHAPDIDMPSFRLPKVPTSQLAKAPTARPQSEESQTPAPRMYVPQLFTTEAHSPDCLCELEVDDEPITFGDSTTVHRVMSTFRFAGKGKALK